jgi:DNA-directed RNA polymerase subunit RPC12/RpoP
VAYWCNWCRKTVTPYPVSIKKLWIFNDSRLVCPECGSRDIVVKADDAPSPAPAGALAGVPSVEEFSRYYKQGRYYSAIGVKADASKKDIRDAINRFQMCHIDCQTHWSKEIMDVRKVLLNPPPAREIPALPDTNRPPTDPRSGRRARWLLEEADRLDDAGQLEGAIELCNQAIKIAPSLTAGYQKRAWLTLMLDDFRPYLDRVIEDCQRVLEDDPDNAGVVNDVGRAYIRKKDNENALLYYRKALELDPSITISSLNMMCVDICVGRYDEAIGIHGELQSTTMSETHQLIACYLICTVMAALGRDYSAFIRPLADKKIFITTRWAWYDGPIDDFIDRLEKEGIDSEKLKQVRYLQAEFKDRYRISQA